MGDYYKTKIRVKEIKENSFIYNDKCSIVKYFNTLEEAKEYKMKQGNIHIGGLLCIKNKIYNV